jgi:hypothetical protein
MIKLAANLEADFEQNRSVKDALCPHRKTWDSSAMFLPLKGFKNLPWVIIMGCERKGLNKWIAHSSSFE